MLRVKLTRRATPDKGKSNGANGAAGKISVDHLSRPRKGESPRNPEVASFVERIATTWQKAVGSIIETGRILIEAKEGPHKLKHGEFLKMIGQNLPFGSRTAQMLMRIAGNSVLSKAKYLSLLPPSWSTLYALTMISDAGLEQLIEGGQVNAGTTLADVKRLGVHPFAELPRALRLLLSFMSKFPDPDEIAEELVELGGFNWLDGYHLYDAMKLPSWIEKLLVAGKREHDAMDAALHPDDPPGPEIIVDERGRHFKDDHPRQADGEHGEE